MTLLLFTIGFCFLKPFFMTGDDPLMTMMAQGAGKDTIQPSEFLIFSNILMGLLLKTLYTAIPHCHWYGLFHLVIFFFSMFCFVFLFLQESFDWKKTVLVLSIFPFEFFHYFIHFEFTFTSFWAAQAGLFLLLDTVRRERRRVFLFISIFLIFLSSLVRWEATCLALTASAPFTVFEILRLKATKRKRLILPFLGLAVLLTTSIGFDQAYYDLSPGWKEVRPYLNAYAQVAEYRNLDANPRIVEILHATSWDYLDFLLFKNWFWQGPQFSLDHLKKIISEAGPTIVGKRTGWEWLFSTDFLLHRFLILAVLFFFTARKKYFLVLFNLLWVILTFLYLFYFKKTVSWIVWPLFSYPTFLGLYYTETGRPFLLSTTWLKKLGLIALAFLVLLSSPILLAEWKENHAKLEKETRIEDDIQALRPQRDRLYVVWATLGGFPLDQLSVFGNYDLFKGFPIYSLTWDQNTPTAKALLARFHIQDLAPDIVGRKDVYFIARRDFLDLYSQYLKQHYGIKPAFLWVFHGNTFDAYQVVRDNS